MLMCLILCGLDMDGHDSLTLTSLSLLYRFVNVLYVRTLFLLLNTFCHAWYHLFTLSRMTIFSVLTCIRCVCFLLMQPNTI
jgi:hypothetical protein